METQESQSIEAADVGDLADVLNTPPPAMVPQIGDPVEFVPAHGEGELAQCFQGRITNVWGPSCVNLAYRRDGEPASASSVFFAGPNSDLPRLGYFALPVHRDLAHLVPSLEAMLDVLAALIVPDDAPHVPPFTRLEEARALPEVDQDALTQPCRFVPGTIEFFKGADDRNMRIVCLAEPDRIGFAQQARP